jgi:hypothetical protein
LHFTEGWTAGKISNFQYLIAVNLFSGRSFQDSSQYPIFPWTVCQFETPVPDLSDPHNFRDLSRPIGAIGESRLSELLRKQRQIEKIQGVGYLYSSYASCSLSLYLWLIRMEPFTSLHIQMQSQRFDHAARLFISIPETYSLVTTHLNDYRELVPEFYFMPEFLHNDNEFDLGSVRGVRVGDVIMPEWANKSGCEFVYVMRKALESDYVSEHLNHWIDLFWGVNQAGQGAADAHNQYVPDLYETAWDNVSERGEQTIKETLLHVGTVPTRLFAGPHPQRKVGPSVSAISRAHWVDLGVEEVGAACVDEKGIMVVAARSVVRYSVTIADGLTVQRGKSFDLAREVLIMAAGDGIVYAVLASYRLISVDQTGVEMAFPELAKVTTIASNEGALAIVSDDATLNICVPWQKFAVPFYGDSIVCCAVSKAFGLAVGGTVSGTIVTCCIHEGTKINVVKLGDGYRPIKIIITGAWGFILTYASLLNREGLRYRLFVHTVNGRLIREVPVPFEITAWCWWSSPKSFDYLTIAAPAGRLYVAEAFYCSFGEVIHRCYSEVRALSYLRDPSAVLAVTADGKVHLVPVIVN